MKSCYRIEVWKQGQCRGVLHVTASSCSKAALWAEKHIVRYYGKGSGHYIGSIVHQHKVEGVA